LFKRKSPPAITPLDLPTILTGTSIVIFLVKDLKKSR
jgi:hypothetical protein